MVEVSLHKRLRPHFCFKKKEIFCTYRVLRTFFFLETFSAKFDIRFQLRETFSLFSKTAQLNLRLRIQLREHVVGVETPLL